VNPIAILDKIPLASVLTVLAALGGLYCLITGSITYQEFLVGLGVTGGGMAALGKVRNDAHKGQV